MLKASLIAAALVIGVAGGAAAAASDAYAPYHHRHYHKTYHSGWYNSPQAFVGVNRYCGPGEIPQSFPDASGVRCELPGGGYHYY